jgi:hypothetical protein
MSLVHSIVNMNKYFNLKILSPSKPAPRVVAGKDINARYSDPLPCAGAVKLRVIAAAALARRHPAPNDLNFLIHSRHTDLTQSSEVASPKNV